MNNVPTGRTRQVTAPQRYELRVTGRLAHRWATWFDGMTLTPQDDGSTVIHGPVADQSALHGLLSKLSDLGLPIISVHLVAPEIPTTPADRPVAGPTHARSTT